MLSRYIQIPLLLILHYLFITNVNAHQPVMDIAPRWNDGYGFQVRHENYGSDKLMSGSSTVDNANNSKVSTNATWVEGVYTFKRYMRATFKLPHIRQSISNNSGTTVREGVGDLVLGAPFKKYTNKGSLTYNWSVTPSIRIPTSSEGVMTINDGSTDLGLSVSYSIETPKFYHMYDLFIWKNNKGRGMINAGNEVGLDMNFGYNILYANTNNTGLFFLWDITLRHQEQGTGVNSQITGGERIHTGPVMVFFKNNMIFRAEYKLPAYESFKGTGLSRGTGLNVGVGFTF
jgi:hypothetical protein